jgi:hypothetical protein
MNPRYGVKLPVCEIITDPNPPLSEPNVTAFNAATLANVFSVNGASGASPGITISPRVMDFF